MRKPRHDKELIAKADTRPGEKLRVLMSADNRHCALIYSTATYSLRVVCGGKAVVETRSMRYRVEIHPTDGRLAVSTGEPGAPVQVFDRNGNLLAHYDTPTDFTIHYIVWLPGDRIAWTGRQDQESKELRHGEDGSLETIVHTKVSWHVFANGEDVTGKLDFVLFWTYGEPLHVAVRENGIRYVVRNDGSQSDSREDCCESLLYCRCGRDRDETNPKPNRAQTETCGRCVKVSYRGHTGPKFVSIADIPVSDNMVYNEDQSRVAYVGLNYSGPATALAWFGHLTFGRMGDKIIENPITRWPAALLLNPYFGSLHIYYEHFAKRYSVVDHDRVWKHVFRTPPTRLFYSISGQLMAIGHDDDKDSLYVDGVPGPKFDSIMNARELISEGRTCYGAKEGENVFRVTV